MLFLFFCVFEMLKALKNQQEKKLVASADSAISIITFYL